tara:strand:+ start:3618 stop:4178 length:561 start_codon:yes stop_codon:yes gene_type:complete
MAMSSEVSQDNDISSTCVACHGQNGISSNPIWPNLAGQNPRYLKSQLQAFKKGPNGDRNNPVMYGIAQTLSDKDMDDLANYYAGLEKSIGTTQDKYLILGRNIYRGGILDIKIQACIACHGPNGLGNYAAGIPMLSGQHADYIYQQLKNFQSGVRSNDQNKMMRNIVHRMTDNEMRAVSHYIQGLY